MMVGAMKPDEHSYANYVEHYFENTMVPVGES